MTSSFFVGPARIALRMLLASLIALGGCQSASPADWSLLVMLDAGQEDAMRVLHKTMDEQVPPLVERSDSAVETRFSMEYPGRAQSRWLFWKRQWLEKGQFAAQVEPAVQGQRSAGLRLKVVRVQERINADDEWRECDDHERAMARLDAFARSVRRHLTGMNNEK